MTSSDHHTNRTASEYGPGQMRLLALLVGFIFPLLMLAFVPVLRRLAHGEPGGFVGFRTAASTSSIENWQTAQTMAAHHFLIIGLISLALTVVAYLIIARAASTTPKTWWWTALALTALQLIALAISAFVIDRSLPKAAGFDSLTSSVVPEASAPQIGLPIFLGLLTPLALIACGPMLRKIATKDANWHTGYRTPKSMSLQHPENWAIANNAAARVSLIAGVVSTIAAITVFAIINQSGTHDTNAWWMASLFFALAPLIPVLAAIPFIERKLTA